jgi:hypothetical protein
MSLPAGSVPSEERASRPPGHLPEGVLRMGDVVVMAIIMGAVSLIGGVTSFFWAPETNGQPLTATSQRTDPHQYRRRRPSMGARA